MIYATEILLQNFWWCQFAIYQHQKVSSWHNMCNSARYTALLCDVRHTVRCKTVMPKAVFSHCSNINLNLLPAVRSWYDVHGKMIPILSVLGSPAVIPTWSTDSHSEHFWLVSCISGTVLGRILHWQENSFGSKRVNTPHQKLTPKLLWVYFWLHFYW